MPLVVVETVASIMAVTMPRPQVVTAGFIICMLMAAGMAGNGQPLRAPPADLVVAAMPTGVVTIRVHPLTNKDIQEPVRMAIEVETKTNVPPT